MEGVKEYLKNNNFINLTEIDKAHQVFYLKNYLKPPKNEGKIMLTSIEIEQLKYFRIITIIN